MNDIHKLNSIINSLEEQAGKITEFGGLLSAVNEARAEIEASRCLLEVSSSESKKVVDENRSFLERLEERVTECIGIATENAEAIARLGGKVESLSGVFEEMSKAGKSGFDGVLSEIESTKAKISDDIASINTLSPQEFSKGISESAMASMELIEKLDRKMEVVLSASKKSQRNLSILIFLSIAALSTVIFLSSSEVYIKF